LTDMSGQSDRWMAESRAALERAMAAEARAAASIERTQGAIDRALQSSGSFGRPDRRHPGRQSALGHSGVAAREIHALLIAQGRALETERLERIAREERAGEIRAAPSQLNVGRLTPARTAF
jgi:hypothetical protein